MYEVLLFRIGLDSQPIQELINLVETKHKYCRYDEILAYTLHKNIPNSILRVITNHQEFTKRDNIFYLGEEDTYGISPEAENVPFPIFDMITIKNVYTQEYVHIDFQDGPRFSKTFVKNSKCKVHYSCMTLDMLHKPQEFVKWKSVIRPFTFFDSYPYFTKSSTNEISRIIKESTKIPKMIFYGTLGNLEKNEYCTTNVKTGDIEEVRKVVKILKEKYPNLIDIADRNEKLERSEWWKKAAEYSVALTIPGHPWCSREHEFWALGIPTLANTYTCPLLFPLIPNKHYVDAGTGGKDFMDREIDQELGADLLAKKFLEVVKYNEYLEKIAKNAQKRYNQFIHPEKAAILLLQDIKENGFLNEI